MRRSAFALLATAVLAAPASAYTEPPLGGYTKETPDKKFVFVVRPALGDPNGPGSDPVARKYPRSGLYRNDGSLTPLWTLPPCYPRDAYPASDGVHLVTVPQIVWTIYDAAPAYTEVLEFYANGRLVRSVRMGELLDVGAFARDRGPGWHAWLQAARIDDAAGTFTVETTAGTRRVFRLSTGELVEAGRSAAAIRTGEPLPAGWCGTDKTKRSAPVFGYVLAGMAVLGAIGVAAVFLRSTARTGG
jgi:hypothetical protein